MTFPFPVKHSEMFFIQLHCEDCNQEPVRTSTRRRSRNFETVKKPWIGWTPNQWFSHVLGMEFLSDAGVLVPHPHWIALPASLSPSMPPSWILSLWGGGIFPDFFGLSLVPLGGLLVPRFRLRLISHFLT